MPALIALFVFLLNFGVSDLIKKVAKPLALLNEKVRKELTEYLAQQEKEQGINLPDNSKFRLRVLNLFLMIKDEDKKEEIRSHMKEVVLKHKGKPKLLLTLNLITITFSVLCIYFLLFFVDSSANLTLSIAITILVILVLIARKRWFFSICFLIISIFFYQYLPYHMAVYIGLNMIRTIFMLAKK